MSAERNRRVLLTVTAFAVVAAMASWWALVGLHPNVQLAPEPSTGSLPTNTVPSEPARTAAQAAIAPTVEGSEPSANSRADAGNQEVQDPDDWVGAARAYLATPPSRDLGEMIIRDFLQKSLDGKNSSAVAMPSAEDLAGDREINPNRRRLSQDEAAMLTQIVSDYGKRLSELRLGKNLAMRLDMVTALASSDCVTVPKTDFDRVWQETSDSAKERFKGDADDFNITALPGPDYQHGRIVVLTRDKYSGYFRAVDAERSCRAEYSVAVRTFFLRSR